VFERIVFPLLAMPERVSEAGGLAVRVFVYHAANLRGTGVLLPLVKSLTKLLAVGNEDAKEAVVQRLVVCLRVAHGSDPEEFAEAAAYLDDQLTEGWRDLLLV